MIIEWSEIHSLWLLLGFGTIFTFLWLLSFKESLHICVWAVALIAVLHTIAGVFCVKVFAVMEAADLGAAGNMSLFGGIFFMPLFYLAGARMAKRKFSQVCDIFTVCMIFTVMCARINCIIAGCCQGRVITGSTLRWPTREAEIIFYIVILWILGKKVKKKKTGGEIYPLYMLSYGIFRFITEFFRDQGNLSGLFHISHFWALIAMALGFSIFIELQSKNKGRGERRR